jgi:hypothetical protein
MNLVFDLLSEITFLILFGVVFPIQVPKGISPQTERVDGLKPQ